MNHLPLIVGFGGYNAAGRCPNSADAADITAQALDGSLIRRIESALFDVDNTPIGKSCEIQASESAPLRVTLAARDLPSPLPFGWTVISESGGRCEVDIWKPQSFTVQTHAPMPVQAAGQLPTGFNPGSFYRSTHHPRGLQLTVLSASDALHSMGVSWQSVVDCVRPDQIGVYASCVMSQLDQQGLGGMIKSRDKGGRVTSKQLPLGLSTMPADFVNAYVLGSVGVTAGIAGACATFAYNLKAAVHDIQSGRRKVVMVGSSEAPILPEVIEGYAAMSALATDEDLRKLDGVANVDYRRSSRPFGQNCGFTLAESGQYVVLMADDLAMELGTQVFGAVPGVFVNADGFKKSISAPGPGNYITMAKAVKMAQSLVGEDAVQQSSFIQAHGSSTPQNRVTESKIFDRVAETFGIENWPVAAVKAYVGHSLGAASGDQLATSLGVFSHGVLPGIKTIDAVAEDVFDQRLSISVSDQHLGQERAQIAFLNSKGFGGNNATATVLSPELSLW